MTRSDTPHGRLYRPVDMATAEANARRYRAKAYRDVATALTRGLFNARG